MEPDPLVALVTWILPEMGEYPDPDDRGFNARDGLVITLIVALLSGLLALSSQERTVWLGVAWVAVLFLLASAWRAYQDGGLT